MQLRKKIPVAIISLIAVPLIFLSIIVYSYTSSILIDVKKNRIKNISEIEGENLNNIIKSQKKEAQLTAKSHEITGILEAERKNMNHSLKNEIREKAEAMLDENLITSPELEDIFVANEEGRIILSGTRKEMNQNIQNEPYFQKSLNGETSISSIMETDTEGKVVLMTTPIKNSQNKVIGILGNKIKVQYFKSKIAELKMDKQGYAYVMDSSGFIVAHPEDSKVGHLVDNQELIKIVGKVQNNEPIMEKFGTYIYQGKEKYMAYDVIPEINWVIIFTQTKSEMDAPARVILTLILGTTVIFLILSIFISFRFSRSITKPIDQLLEAMNKAAEGNLSAKCNFEGNDEFGKLSRNFNGMIVKLCQSYEELSAVYEELSATEEELRAQYEELEANEEQLRKSEEKYKLALEGANDVIWEWNSESKELIVSDKWKEIAGFSAILRGTLRNFIRLVHKTDIKNAVKSAREHIKNEADYFTAEFRIKTESGGYKWILSRGKALRDGNGEIIKMAGSISDISDRKKIESKIRYLAYYDTLTQLPNRTLFIEKLEEELVKSKRSGLAGAVMFVDLDNFKNINDTLGHDYGDKLLETIAGYFREFIYGKNIVCRFGGDEFIIMAPEMKSNDEITSFSQKVLGIFNDPFVIDEKLIYITASIGIAIYNKDGEDVNTILKNADTAMYKAKASGKNAFAFFQKEMYAGLERRTKIETILREALSKNKFELYYQPQICLKDNKIIGFEALLRLRHEIMGFLPPNEFIPIAEECGLIKEIGEWCLKSACSKNKEWRDKGYEFGTISVNISAIQFQQSNFIEMIIRTLKEVNLKPEYLEIEITETAFMEYLETNVEALQNLRNTGVKIALDDFGTGYSSLSYLRRLPIHTLKIDKSFIDEVCSSTKEQAIIRGIIQLAHQMGLQVVAEGVEDQQQLDLLKEKECDIVQGYFYSKPLPSAEAEEMLMNYRKKQ